jgi:hypothetical protein
VFGQAAQVVVIDRCSAHFWTPNDAPAERVPVGAVVPGNPPRTGVENASPAKLMASASESPSASKDLAAMRPLEGTSAGTSDGAFVTAVSANVTHGLPATGKTEDLRMM